MLGVGGGQLKGDGPRHAMTTLFSRVVAEESSSFDSSQPDLASLLLGVHREGHHSCRRGHCNHPDSKEIPSEGPLVRD